MKKRIIAILITAVLCMQLCACGAVPAKTDIAEAKDTAAPVLSVEPQYSLKPLSATNDNEKYCGTWEAVYVQSANGNKNAVSDFEEKGIYNFSKMNLVLTDDNEYLLTALPNCLYETGNYKVTASGISINNNAINYKDGYLLFKLDNNTHWFEKISDDQIINEKKSDKFYIGTWEVSYVGLKDKNNAVLVISPELLKDSKDYKDAYNYLVSAYVELKEDGTCVYHDSSKQQTYKWKSTPTGITVGSEQWNLVKDCLAFDSDAGALYLTKVEDDSSAPVSGLRPEFKEAMDAYEAFFDEYTAMYKEYMANPTNIGLMTKYFDMLSRLEEMEEKFDAWEDEDMTDEELKYYMDVTLRIESKLLGML